MYKCILFSESMNLNAIKTLFLTEIAAQRRCRWISELLQITQLFHLMTTNLQVSAENPRCLSGWPLTVLLRGVDLWITISYNTILYNCCFFRTTISQELQNFTNYITSLNINRLSLRCDCLNPYLTVDNSLNTSSIHSWQ